MSEAEGSSLEPQGLLEVQGKFSRDSSLHAAIEGLRHAGFVRANASLPEDRVEGSTGEDSNAPTPEDHQQMRTLTASLAGYAGAVVAGVVVLSSGAAIPLAAGAAVLAGFGSGAAMEVVGRDLGQQQVKKSSTSGAVGLLVLAMRVKDQAQADEVTRIMRGSGAAEVKLVTQVSQALTPGINSASWTG